jgi:hypothetical protein
MSEEKEESTTFHTEASYLEIYNEKVRDLLQVKWASTAYECGLHNCTPMWHPSV